MSRDLTQRPVGRLLIWLQVGLILISIGDAALSGEWWMWILTLWCVMNLGLTYGALRRGIK